MLKNKRNKYAHNDDIWDNKQTIIIVNQVLATVSIGVDYEK